MPDSAFYFADKQLELAKQSNNSFYVGLSYFLQGKAKYYMREVESSFELLQKALNIFQNINKPNEEANTFNELGNLYYSQRDYERARDYYLKELKIAENLSDTVLITKAHIGIGNTYLNEDNYEMALEQYEYCLMVSTATSDSLGMFHALNGSGYTYYSKGDIESAEIQYKKALEIALLLNDPKSIASIYASLAMVYLERNDFDTAIEYNLASLNLAQEQNAITTIRYVLHSLYETYKLAGRYKDALDYYEKHTALKDSIDSENIEAEFARIELESEFEKKEALSELEYESRMIRQKQISNQKEKEQIFIIIAVSGMLILVAIFLFVINKRLKITRNQKDMILEQKVVIEEVHKELTDSINYAERIQRSFLATKEMLEVNLGQHFVYFNPKEAVSGDFYWAGKLSNGNFAICCADSTGHGVPGAIMSILNISSIEKAVEKKITKPAEIFNETRKLIIDRLKKDGSLDGGKDGMDASLICLNPEKDKMQFVAAQNPIWIIRDDELIDIKAEKMPVGKYDHDHIPFKGGEFELQKGDIIYMITDGFQDQFGGEKGKKFKVKPMKLKLVEISNMSMIEQHKMISDMFEKWKGNLEQVDDVCIVGIKV